MKLATFQVRQKLLKNLKNLKTSPYGGCQFKDVNVNADLTKFMSGILFDSRKLAKERPIYTAWSSNRAILSKDNPDIAHKISKAAELVQFEMAVRRPPESAAAGPS